MPTRSIPRKAKGIKSGISGGSDSIAAYAKAQPPLLRAMCDALRKLIDAALPKKATSKVWHGSPVWFIDDNPVVGYSIKGKAVCLLFWNGQALDEPVLRPVGKYGAAEARFTDADEIDPKTVRRCLTMAGSKVFDSRAFFAKKRAAAR